MPLWSRLAHPLVGPRQALDSAVSTVVVRATYLSTATRRGPPGRPLPDCRQGDRWFSRPISPLSTTTRGRFPPPALHLRLAERGSGRSTLSGACCGGGAARPTQWPDR